MSLWTETGEKALDTIKVNAKQLSEKYLDEYKSFKNWLMLINAPLVLLSAANAYAIIELDSVSHTIQMASAGSSLLIATIIGGELCLGVQKRLENSYARYRDFDNLKEDVSGVLTLNREERKVDANHFIANAFKKYQELTEEDKYITKFAGNVKSFATDRTEDMQSFLEDHWNILFRPQFRKIKHKNEKVINALKETGQQVQETLSTIVEPVIELAKEGEKEIKKSSFISMITFSKNSDSETEEKKDNEKKDDEEKQSFCNYLWISGKKEEEEKEKEKITEEMTVETIYKANNNANKVYDTVSHKWIEKK
jgi:hypothetical protein